MQCMQNRNTTQCTIMVIIVTTRSLSHATTNILLLLCSLFIVIFIMKIYRFFGKKEHSSTECQNRKNSLANNVLYILYACTAFVSAITGIHHAILIIICHYQLRFCCCDIEKVLLRVAFRYSENFSAQRHSARSN